MARSKVRKQSANQREYAKQVKRIKQFISRAEKRGYRFEADILPPTPKRVTKQAVQRLKQITPNVLYEKSTTIDYETGEIISGTLGRKLEKQESARKSAETRKRNKKKEQQYYPNGGDIIAYNVVDDFIARLQEPDPTVFPYKKSLASKIEDLIRSRREAKTTLLSLTNSVINEIGKQGLAWRLEKSVSDVNDALDAMLYRASSSDEVRSACMHLATVIKGSPLTFTEAMDIAEQDEYYESYEYPS